MKNTALLLFAIFGLLGCVATQQENHPLEYKIIKIPDSRGTHVITDESGKQMKIAYTPEMKAEETAEKLSVEGWTLTNFDRMTEFSNQSDGLFQSGSHMTLIFTRPKK